jgi:hypothetical protein
MSVVEAVQRDLEELGPKAGESALAATAKVLAERLDGDSSTTSVALCAKELAATLRELRALAPPKREEDRVDEIAKRREQRLKSSAAG